MKVQYSARSVLLGSTLPCTSCLCFPCTASWKTAKFSELLPWTLGDTTGWVESSPAVVCNHRLLMKLSAQEGLPVGTKYCRSAESSCRICNWQQQRARQSMAMLFKQCMHQSHPLSCLWLKGPWSLVLGPSIAYFNAWWPKESSMHFWYGMQCIWTNQWDSTSITSISRGVACMSMQCNLRHVD